jgi:trehalose synthase
MLDPGVTTPAISPIDLGPLDLERFDAVIGARRSASLRHTIRAARAILGGRIVWNINSTAAGGGVAEMLQTLVRYARGAGIDARWLVIGGDADFFTITKRIHNGLHGAAGDGGPLEARERTAYESTTARAAQALSGYVRPNDVVLLHDPQTAGLAPRLRDLGAKVVWRCHVGADAVNDSVERAWAFLRPWVEAAHACVFSRVAYAPAWLPPARLHVVQPSIDAFSVKNQGLHPESVRAVLSQIGLVANGRAPATPEFRRSDGSPGRVERRAHVVREGPTPDVRVPIVVQVSRWDRLKDMAGVMTGFVRHTGGTPHARLALVGPAVEGVSDDPEGAAVYTECLEAWRMLPDAVRRRVDLVTLPMDDSEENAAMVNAIQRHAAVVVQKSLHEGFGLTVTEAMWKGRPIVASAVGGIQDQIVDGRHGLLVPDPADLDAFGLRLARLLEDRPLARRLGRNAHRRCVAHFLAPRHLTEYVTLFEHLDG